jgi:hypothetical protein
MREVQTAQRLGRAVERTPIREPFQISGDAHAISVAFIATRR